EYTSQLLQASSSPRTRVFVAGHIIPWCTGGDQGEQSFGKVIEHLNRVGRNVELERMVQKLNVVCNGPSAYCSPLRNTVSQPYTHSSLIPHLGEDCAKPSVGLTVGSNAPLIPIVYFESRPFLHVPDTFVCK